MAANTTIFCVGKQRKRDLRKRVLQRLASGALFLPSGTPFWLAKKDREVVLGILLLDPYQSLSEHTQLFICCRVLERDLHVQSLPSFTALIPVQTTESELWLWDKINRAIFYLGDDQL